MCVYESVNIHVFMAFKVLLISIFFFFLFSHWKLILTHTFLSYFIDIPV